MSSCVDLRTIIESVKLIRKIIQVLEEKDQDKFNLRVREITNSKEKDGKCCRYCNMRDKISEMIMELMNYEAICNSSFKLNEEEFEFLCE